ncbi:ECF-type sigma factor [Tahibacter soli]|jgi:RNA polymerase sigma factor (TIGR02999 family)|uniref:ECF-type sigma factor n=1 Tax=Tahibacter soli TaxID=2983605 RepID=A0A9X3YH67_9GAMM|nr:ECF-type sigma factor [Tahibacter soli]MDC8011056.1 ECF-type sigma factor [Tahibacter soli]
MNEAITELLAAAGRGDEDARQHLFRRLYDELHRCAHRQLRGARDQTLSTTALVHETYLKLAGGALDATSRAHFMALAARAMRQVLIDQARRAQAGKRGGGIALVTLDEHVPDGGDIAVDVLALDQALSQLETVDDRAARVVQWHFFGGLSFAEIAQIEGLTVRTVLRDWQAARALLAVEMRQGGGDGSAA